MQPFDLGLAQLRLGVQLPCDSGQPPRSGKQSATKRAELRGKISMLPGLNRFLRVIPGGLLRVDKTKAKAEALGRLRGSL